MSKSNKSARKELEMICGKGCFFRRAHCAERIEQMGGIKTFKTFCAEKRYTRKKISYQMTYHHLKHRSEGGRTSVENGANMEEIAHQYIHSLPRDQEEIVNDMMREFKMGFGIMMGNGEMVDTRVIQLDFNDLGDDVLTIPVYDNTREEYEKRIKNHNGKRQRLQNPTRAMKKRELQKMIDEEEWEL